MEYGVPVPSAFVFQPENVYPDLVRVFELRFALEEPTWEAIYPEPPFSIKVTELVEVVPDEITSDLIFPSGSVLCTAFDILPTRKFQVLLALGTLLENDVVASEVPVADELPLTTTRQTPPGPT